MLVEGPQIVPDLLPPDARALFLIPSPEFQAATLSPRPMPSSDPERALANRLVKDRLCADRVAALARGRGFPVVVVDGSRGPDATRTASNLRAWVASGDGRAQGDRRFIFACECGRRGCAEQVLLTLAELGAGAPVVAPAHARW